jgi:hypothetical protein
MEVPGKAIKPEEAASRDIAVMLIGYYCCWEPCQLPGQTQLLAERTGFGKLQHKVMTAM